MDTYRDFLKCIIDKNGFDYLFTNAFTIYQELLNYEGVNPKYARILLVTLLAKIPEQVKNESLDLNTLSNLMQVELLITKPIADEFAAMYQSLFSNENIAKWKKNVAKGLIEFCRKDWSFPWEGFGVWYADDMHMDCECSTEAILEVVNKKLVKAETQELISANPFVTSQEIYEIYHAKLVEILNRDFEEYTQADDYYPPVTEDYDSNYLDVLENFCARHGFEIVSYEFDGSTSDYYEPN
jgi:hypothetical protein